VCPAKAGEAINMPFALRTWVGPRKDSLHIADCFGANTVLCLCNTMQPSSWGPVITPFYHANLYHMFIFLPVT